MSKSINFLMNSFLGSIYRNLAISFWSHCWCPSILSKFERIHSTNERMNEKNCLRKRMILLLFEREKNLQFLFLGRSVDVVWTERRDRDGDWPRGQPFEVTIRKIESENSSRVSKWIARNKKNSVARWLVCFFNIWPFTIMKICPIASFLPN